MKLSLILCPTLTLGFVCLASAEPTVSSLSSVSATLNGTPIKGEKKATVGDVIRTGTAGTVSANFLWGGVSSIIMMPRSKLALDAYGNRANGGRFSTFKISGETYFRVGTTNPNSEVKACFTNVLGRNGCALLKSAARLAPVTNSDKFVVAVSEGAVKVQDELQQNPPILVAAGFHSFFNPDGTFTQPIKSGGRGYDFGIPRSRAIATFRAWEGWRFLDGSSEFVGAVGTPTRVVPPSEIVKIEPDRPL
jgi:hypothetical protein